MKELILKPLAAPRLNVNEPSGSLTHRRSELMTERKKKAIVCDVDGVLSLNVTGRGWLDWKRVGEDQLSQPIKDLLDLIVDSGKLDVILMTARDDEARSETVKWLGRNGVHYDQLYMRPPDNDDDSAKVKEELYFKFVEPIYNVVFALDDDPGIVAMWERNKVKCFHVLSDKGEMR